MPSPTLAAGPTAVTTGRDGLSTGPTRHGAAHAPSPDVRLGLPGLGSLGCRLRFGILPALGGIRRLTGHGQPRAWRSLHGNAAIVAGISLAGAARWC